MQNGGCPLATDLPQVRTANLLCWVVISCFHLLSPGQNTDALTTRVDLVVSDSHSVQLLYKSGSFIQHDLRKLNRPPDMITRQALTWNANSFLFFVADKPRPFDPPYDDL